MQTRVLTYAPSNIAWIKYMGKLAASKGPNLAENPSLSMTLDGLRTWAEVRPGNGAWRWVPELPEGATNAQVPALSEAGQIRILKHAEHVAGVIAHRLPNWRFRERAHIELRTANTFPAGVGIASSASSFAAVALGVATHQSAEHPRFVAAIEARDPEVMAALSELAREGSGSACRSLEGPFTEWSGTHAKPVRSALPELAHFVILVSAREKEVSSSEAHARVKTSHEWAGRPVRAAIRVARMRLAVERGDFAEVASLAWEDSWEMHSLFHTSVPSFSYWAASTLETLLELKRDLPRVIVTMDAGPNIHLTVPASEAGEWRMRLIQRYGNAGYLEDRPGAGARVTAWT